MAIDPMPKTGANHVPLSPLSFLTRTSLVHGERTAIVYGDVRQSWRETERRCHLLASALSRAGVTRGDTVAIMAPNIPAFVEAHFGVPLCGAVLNSLNTRLDAVALAFILEHSEAKVLLMDVEYGATVRDALSHLASPPIVVDIEDPVAPGDRVGTVTYEAFLRTGSDVQQAGPTDEWSPITLNYTSGTTGDPKGVVYSHRGAYLNAVANVVTWSVPRFPVYLWTLPMFHCNGWCFPWTITMMAGTHICLRRVEGAAILDAIATHKVTHLCGAPVVMSMMASVPETNRPAFEHDVGMMVAGAPPPASVIRAVEAMSIEVTHVYGLTEVYGPCVVSAWQPEWNELSTETRATLKARQGVAYEMQEDVIVADTDTLEPLPMNGEIMGEILIRGNSVMMGYLKDPETTIRSFDGGWFHTGDLAVRHPDGYIEIRDRSKDIIISGGENISSIEVESVLYRMPGVAAAAVVAMPDERWGETPCAFIEMQPGFVLSSEEVIAFCRARLAHFKCPSGVRFGPIPKTSTGKVQKFDLRQKLKTT